MKKFARLLHAGHVYSGEVVGDQLLLPEGRSIPLEGKLLPPVTPSKIVAVALNYRAHALEMKKPVPEEPMFFTKPTTALIGPDDAIVLPPESSDVHHEGELGIVLSKTLKNATPEEAKAAVLGVTCVNDVTARDIQRKQNHYTRAKGYDTFCPVGPYLVTGLDIEDLRVRVRVNGEIRQDGRTSDMIFGPWHLLSFISRIMTLLPGDLVSTGTPPGVGPIRAGETVEVEIDGVGVLRNRVVAA
jgi:2-keto-4-pentenoate hydratase/2-oxohepta-3-ene-1,7-dioic acid hydratase in catechol pathway